MQLLNQSIMMNMIEAVKRMNESIVSVVVSVGFDDVVELAIHVELKSIELLNSTDVRAQQF